MTGMNDIWWTRVPSAIQLVDKAKDTLLRWKSVAIDEAPFQWQWGGAFIDTVISQLQSQEYSIAFDQLDLESLPGTSTILDGIADQLSIGYMMQRSIANLLPELPDAGCIWFLQNVNDERLRELEQLMRQSSACNAQIAFIFISPLKRSMRGCFQFALSPTKLDLQYFAWTLLMSRLPDYLLEYASMLAVELSAGRPDLCEDICSQIQPCMQDPEGVCNWLTIQQRQSGIHTAQVRVIEPCIEYGRHHLIKQLDNRLDKILPFDDEYGNRITRPIEVELRNLIYYRNELQLSTDEKKLLDMLYVARNKLGHLERLSYSEAEMLLKETARFL